MAERKRKQEKKPRFEIKFDDVDYTEEERVYLWTRFIQVLTKLEGESLQAAI